MILGKRWSLHIALRIKVNYGFDLKYVDNIVDQSNLFKRILFKDLICQKNIYNFCRSLTLDNTYDCIILKFWDSIIIHFIQSQHLYDAVKYVCDKLAFNNRVLNKINDKLPK